MWLLSRLIKGGHYLCKEFNTLLNIFGAERSIVVQGDPFASVTFVATSVQSV